MSLQSILLPVRGDGKGNNVLAHAAVLAKRFAAHVDVLHCRPRPRDLLPFGVPVPRILQDQMMASVKSVADEEEAVLRAEFRELIATLGLERAEQGSVIGPTALFEEAEGRQIDVIRNFGRLADLICVAKPDRDRNLGMNTLKTALFNTARPVLMCPETESVSETLGSHIAIGWNGSIEATRAVGMASALILGAETVTVLSAGAELPGASGDKFCRSLQRKGVTANLQRFEKGRNLGLELLAQATSAGADMLLMGAYGDSHERETVFGGNTQTVVDAAELPVVMVH